MDVVNAMAIGAYWNIWIRFFNQGRTMYALFVLIEDLRMALSANLGYMSARLVWRSDVMSAMTIRTDGRIQVPFPGGLGMHAVLGLIIIIRMAFLARQVVDPGKLTFRLKLNFRMRVGGDVGMAGLTFDADWAMNGLAQHFGRNV